VAHKKPRTRAQCETEITLSYHPDIGIPNPSEKKMPAEWASR